MLVFLYVMLYILIGIATCFVCFIIVSAVDNYESSGSARATLSAIFGFIWPIGCVAIAVIGISAIIGFLFDRWYAQRKLRS